MSNEYTDAVVLPDDIFGDLPDTQIMLPHGPSVNLIVTGSQPRQFAYEEGMTLGQVMDNQGLSFDTYPLITVNNGPASAGTVLHANDRIFAVSNNIKGGAR